MITPVPLVAPPAALKCSNVISLYLDNDDMITPVPLVAPLAPLKCSNVISLHLAPIDMIQIFNFLRTRLTSQRPDGSAAGNNFPPQDGGDLGARRALWQDVQGALRRRHLYVRRQDLQLLPQEGTHRAGVRRRRGRVGPLQDEGHQRRDPPPRRRL